MLRRYVERGGCCKEEEALSVAAFWAGAVHPRRQNHREMPPPGASAPAFAATVKPARARPNANIQGKTRRQRVMERVLWDLLRDLLRERAEDGLLPAAIPDFRPRLANRCKVFPIYGPLRASILKFRPRLGNRCRVFPVYGPLRTLILDFKPRLANRCSTIVATTMNGPPATAVATTRSVSDPILRYCKEE